MVSYQYVAISVAFLNTWKNSVSAGCSSLMMLRDSPALSLTITHIRKPGKENLRWESKQPGYSLIRTTKALCERYLTSRTMNWRRVQLERARPRLWLLRLFPGTGLERIKWMNVLRVVHVLRNLR